MTTALVPDGLWGLHRRSISIARLHLDLLEETAPGIALIW